MFNSKFEKAFNLIMQWYDSQGNIVQSLQKTKQLKQIIKQMKRKYRNVKQLMPEFKYQGFIIGRSMQFNSDKSTCMLSPRYNQGNINFGDIIVCWKNPKDQKDVKWFCLHHFCQAFNVDKNQLLDRYLSSVDQKSSKIPSQIKIALQNSINWTQMKASKWGRQTDTYQDQNKDTTICSNPQMISGKQLNQLKGHIINYQTNDALNQYYLILTITSGSFLDKNLRTEFQTVTRKDKNIEQQLKSVLTQVRPLFSQADFIIFQQELLDGNLYSTQPLPKDNRLYLSKYIKLPQSGKRIGVKFKLVLNNKGMKKTDAKNLMSSFNI